MRGVTGTSMGLVPAAPQAIPSSLAISQTGSEATGFSGSSYFSVTGSGFAFGNNTTIAIGFDLHTLPVVPQTIVQDALAATNGWQVQIDSTGQILIAFPGGGTTISTTLLASIGFNSVVITKDVATTDKVRVSLNNLSEGIFTIPASVSTNSSSICRIGNDDTGATPFSAGAVLWFQGYSVVLSDSDMNTKAAMGQQNRWIPVPSSQESSLVVDWEVGASRDWNGIASTTTSQGSVPVTWTVTGSGLSLAPLQELYFPWSAIQPYAQDNAYSTSPYGTYLRLIFGSQDQAIYVDTTVGDIFESSSALFSAPVWSISQHNIATFCGATYGSLQAGVRGCMRVATPGSGFGRTIEVWSGPQTISGGVGPVYGTTIQAVRLQTVSGQAVNPIPAPSNVLNILGDSITADGLVATPVGQFGSASIYRNAVRGKANVVVDGGGNSSLFENCTIFFATPAAYAAHVAATIANVNAGGLQVVLVAIMVNDYLLAQQSAASYGTMLTTFMNALHTDAPAATIIVHGTTLLGGSYETLPNNTYGNIPDDYRNAAAAAVSAIGASWAKYSNYKNVIMTADISTLDNIHLLNSGQAKVAAQYQADKFFGTF
jgi:hypothetical protein